MSENKQNVQEQSLQDQKMDLAVESALDLTISSDHFANLDLQKDITGGSAGFCSMTAEDNQSKVTLFNACSNPDKISSMIGKQIKMIHFFVEVIQTVSEQSGEIVNVPRVVIIDEKGHGYQGVSIGLYNSVKRVVSMFGLPGTWDKPHTVEVQQIELKQGRTFNLLMID